MTKHVLFILLTILLFSCENTVTEEMFPKTTFYSSFPKRNCNLTHFLGENLTIKSGTDTLVLKISSFKNYNLIIDSKTEDTLFKGKVCKFRGMFYFNQQLNDTSYWIYAIKLNNKLIYGLNYAWQQLYLVDNAIENGQHKKLVKYLSEERIRLHSDKRELKNLYSGILDSLLPDTILYFAQPSLNQFDTTRTITPIDADEFELLSKVYPNPTSDFVNIELQQKSKIIYHLTDSKGNRVLQGQFADRKNTIDMSTLTAGFYYLILIDQTANYKETTKIIKIK